MRRARAALGLDFVQDVRDDLLHDHLVVIVVRGDLPPACVKEGGLLARNRSATGHRGMGRVRVRGWLGGRD